LQSRNSVIPYETEGRRDALDPNVRILKSAHASIEAITRIETSVVLHDRGLRLVEMTDVVLGRILRAALIEQRPHAVFEVGGAVAFADDVVLMEDVAKEMPVIELMNHWPGYVGRQVLEPVRVVAPERDVQGDDIFDLLPVDGPVAHCSACGGEPVQERLRGFRGRAFEEIAARRGKID